MCGIFGLIVGEGSRISDNESIQCIHDLFKLSKQRGSDSSGLLLATESSIDIFKAPISGQELLKYKDNKKIVNRLLLERSNFTYTFIGHCRLETSGDNDFTNIQPISIGHTVGVHNGIIINEGLIKDKFSLEIDQSLSDSNTLFTLVERLLNVYEDPIYAVTQTFEKISGSTTIATIFSNYNICLLGTNNGSLYFAKSLDENIFIFASEFSILESIIHRKYLNNYFLNSNIEQVKINKLIAVDLKTSQIISDEIHEKYSYKSLTDRKINYQNVEKLKKVNLSSLDLSSSRFRQIENDYIKIIEKYKNIKRCLRCILPETMPFIQFDELGICNICSNYNKVILKSLSSLTEAIDKNIQRDRKNRKIDIDCIVGLSGGRDSCYALHFVKKELGYKPLAFTYDWGMVTDLARRNISRICGSLGVEHIWLAADIRKKRNNIKQNIKAWLNHPSLGMIPLFMAGDKSYFYYSNSLMKVLGVSSLIFGENMLEKTDFKTGFANCKPDSVDMDRHYVISLKKKCQLIWYYANQYLKNPCYFNLSFLDNVLALFSYYFVERNYVNLFRYHGWNEEQVVGVISAEYDWEKAPDTDSTWRIGDGTAPFYNYIYYLGAGFTENDTFRSNQIREGLISREEAMKTVCIENHPRWSSIEWYLDIVGLDFISTISRINNHFLNQKDSRYFQ